MKTEELKAIGLTPIQIQSVMKCNGIDIEKLKKEIARYKSENLELHSQLLHANTIINQYKTVKIDELQRSVLDWKIKYTTELANLHEKLAKVEYENAVYGFFFDMKFTSIHAKNSIIAEFNSKKFKLEKGKLLGANEYLTFIRKADPGAFENE